MDQKRRKKGPSPTQRSLKVLRDADWTVDVVERWIRNPKHPAGGFRKDFLGCADLVALKPGERVLFVQTTDASSVAKHIEKLRESEHLAVLIACGRVEIHGWAKPSKTIRRWRQRIVELGPEDVIERKVSRMAVRTKVEREQRELFAAGA